MSGVRAATPRPSLCGRVGIRTSVRSGIAAANAAGAPGVDSGEAQADDVNAGEETLDLGFELDGGADMDVEMEDLGLGGPLADPADFY